MTTCGALFIQTAVSSVCLPGWHQDGESCYYVSGITTTGDLVVAACDSEGGSYPVVIDSQTEQDFVESIV